MPKYTIYLSNRAKKDLDKLIESVAQPIFSAISKLEDNPRPPGYKKLRGRYGYRIRVGNYRVIYDIVEGQLIIDVITLGHRKDIYN